MVMASGRPSRPGDVRLAHGARVDSVRVLACCTLRTISSAHQGAQGPAEQGERLWLAAEASSSSSSSSSQFDLSLLATRDASSPHRLLPVMRTWRGHQEIQALDDSLGDIDVLLLLSPPRPVDRSPACLECTLAHTQLAAASCSPPPRLAAGSARSALSTRPALRASSLTRLRPSSRVRSSQTGSTLDYSTRLRTTTRLPLHSEHPGPPSHGGEGFPRAERSHQPRGPGWRSGGSVGEQHGAAEQRGEQGSGGEAARGEARR